MNRLWLLHCWMLLPRFLDILVSAAPDSALTQENGQSDLVGRPWFVLIQEIGSGRGLKQGYGRTMNKVRGNETAWRSVLLIIQVWNKPVQNTGWTSCICTVTFLSWYQCHSFFGKGQEDVISFNLVMQLLNVKIAAHNCHCFQHAAAVHLEISLTPLKLVTDFLLS